MTVSPFFAGLRCRCPACGTGKLFGGFLKVVSACDHCGQDLSAHEEGDGPAVFIILVMGAIVVGLALWTEIKYQPPLWLHAVLWGPLILVGSLAMLRPFKATIIALQFKHRREDYDGDGTGDSTGDGTGAP